MSARARYMQCYLPRFLSVCLALMGTAISSSATTVVWFENGISAVDSAQPQLPALRRALNGALFVSSEQLSSALEDRTTDLLVLPYGSIFPEACWDAIDFYLERGGNLLTIGGRPFTRPAYRMNGSWKIRPDSYVFARQLFISDYQPTPSSAGLQLESNPDIIEKIPEFSWTRAFSLVIRLSDEEVTQQQVGTSGTPDSDLKALAWGVKQGRKLSAPIVQIDHFQNHFVGGRWIMVNCEITDDIYSSLPDQELLGKLGKLAARGSDRFRVTPVYPLFIAGEPWEFQIEWLHFRCRNNSKVRLELTVENGARKEGYKTIELSDNAGPRLVTITMEPKPELGFRIVTAKLTEQDGETHMYRTGFWMRDQSYLISGPGVSIDHDFFRVDGRALPVVGTTYMASDAQRLYFRYPNPYIWDRDMNDIAKAGLNMLRTGWWTDWNALTGGSGLATESTIRTTEAFLMTARKYGLPVQWNLFAFMPDAFGGGNPYLGVEAVRREQNFVASVVSPFRQVPFVIWDLINEPSFDNPAKLWTTRPNNDSEERRQWNEWLLARYGSRQEIAAAWNTLLPAGDIAVPEERDYALRSSNDGGKPLSVYDFNLFAQDKFTQWAQTLRATIRATGSQQLITVGQDEGGALSSPSPAFFKTAVDFTTVHSWWLYDWTLWDSLAAKQVGLPMLVQETGVQNEFDADGRTRRTPENEAMLLERKVAMALGTGAGAIEWLWNINAMMRSQQEVTIGVIRPDGTERPETRVMEEYASFVAQSRDHFQQPAGEDIAILSSQALQYSTMSDLASAAVSRSVRVIHYDCHTLARVVSENNVDNIRGSKLVILPSAQMLRETTWKALISYVEQGGNLLITGPAERDEHWRRISRLSQLGVHAAARALTFRGAQLQIDKDSVNIGFPLAVQQRAESLEFQNGASYVELKHGRGRLFVVAYPVELAESAEPTRRVYENVLSRLGIAAPFEGQSGSASILIRPVMFADSILYLMVSESAQDENIDIRDRQIGAKLKFVLPAQRAKMILLGKKDGVVLGSYDPPLF